MGAHLSIRWSSSSLKGSDEDRTQEMEDIGKTIWRVMERTRCNIEEVRKLKRKFEDLKLEQDIEKCGMLSLDHLIEQNKYLVNEVIGLSNYSKFPKRIHLDLNVWEDRSGFIFPTGKLIGETTAIRKMEKIYDFINGDVRKIGVYGKGGIGKTRVMQHINNRILKEKMDKFDCVIWVTVSKDSSVFKLQDNIARKLNVNLSNYEDTMTRAGILLEAFQKKRRSLIILDDLWQEFSLEEVGIPDPNYANGCKLVLTTRLRQVCQRMECEVIKMDLLSRQEAWSLFLSHVGLDILQIKGMEPIVKDVVSECACLPLTITTTALSMRGQKETVEWRYTLKRLRTFSKEPGDKAQLKFSYKRLKGLSSYGELRSSYETSSSNPNDAKNVSIIGMGGYGTTRIHNDHSIITIEMIHHHHYPDRGTR